MNYTERPSDPEGTVKQDVPEQFGIQLRTCQHYRLLVMNEEAIEDIQGGIQQ